MRVAQEPKTPGPHSCAYFRQWGTYQSFDYVIDGPQPKPGIPTRVKYVGRAPLIPEALSGCRKAPIVGVGINPNLPGWARSKRGALNPSFDDYRQYARYFPIARRTPIVSVYLTPAAVRRHTVFDFVRPRARRGNRVDRTRCKPIPRLSRTAARSAAQMHWPMRPDVMRFSLHEWSPAFRTMDSANRGRATSPPMTTERDGIVPMLSRAITSYASSF
jgi:hypothetical protein